MNELERLRFLNKLLLIRNHQLENTRIDNQVCINCRSSWNHFQKDAPKDGANCPFCGAKKTIVRFKT